MTIPGLCYLFSWNKDNTKTQNQKKEKKKKILRIHAKARAEERALPAFSASPARGIPNGKRRRKGQLLDTLGDTIIFRRGSRA
jgi:hypothetical protein